MPSRYVRAALLVAGLLLVANPFLVFPHATDPTFEYRAIELPSDEYPFPVEIGVEDIEGIACETYQEDWGCVFDEAIRTNGSVQFQPEDEVDIDRAMTYGERFFDEPGGPYRRVLKSDNGTVTARLVPVSWQAVLENISVSRDELSPRERRLIDDRNLTTHRPIDWTEQRNPRGGIVVQSDDTYHLLWEVSGDRHPPKVEAMVIETTRAIGVGLGLLIFAVAIMLEESSE